MMYAVFLFFMHVVADVDDFFVLSFSLSHLMVFCSRFIIMSCLTIIVFVAFPESLYCAVLCCAVLCCAVLCCTVLSSESTELYGWCSLWSVNQSPCESLSCTVLSSESTDCKDKIQHHCLRFCLDHLSCVKMAAFQSCLQSGKQRKVGWAGDDSHVVFGTEFSSEKGSVRRCAVVMQQPVLLSPKFKGSLRSFMQSL
jgi:hypothetical protein